MRTDNTYYLGIDGGATGTDFALSDSYDNIIRELRMPPSNPFDRGMEEAQTVLLEGIMKITEGIDHEKICLFAGLSGGKTGGNAVLFNSFFSEFGFKKVSCDSDTANAVAVALKGRNGVVSIIGTGNSTCVSHDGKYEIIGGHGYLFDKGCSAYDLGLSALSAAFRVEDGIAKEGTLSALVKDKCGQNMNSIIHDLYSKSSKALVASFGPLVFTAAQFGDEDACRIIRSSAKSLSEYILCGLNKLGDETAPAVLVGGMTHFESQIRPLLENYTGLDDTRLIFCHENPVKGALYLAKNLK